MGSRRHYDRNKSHRGRSQEFHLGYLDNVLERKQRMSGCQRKKKRSCKKNPAGFWKKLQTSGLSCAGEPGHSWELLGEPEHWIDWVGHVSRRIRPSQELPAIKHGLSGLHRERLCKTKGLWKKYLFLFVCLLSVCQVSV